MFITAVDFNLPPFDFNCKTIYNNNNNSRNIIWCIPYAVNKDQGVSSQHLEALVLNPATK